jgi:two-component system phosphate regulon sensor histidine kinase PhoR
MFSTGIRTRLIASFLLLILLSLLTFGSYVLWHFYQYTIESLTAHLVQQAMVVEELVETQVSNANTAAAIDSKIKAVSAQIELRITIININGKVLADSWENPALMDNHFDRPEVHSALDGTRGQAMRYSATLSKNMLYIAIPMKQGGIATGVVRVSTTLAPIEEAFNGLRNVLIAAFILTSGIAVLVSIRLARKFTAPIEQITIVAHQMSEGRLDERVYIKSGDEVEILAHTLNTLAANLDDKVKEILTEKTKFELILSHMDNAVILMDRYGRVTTANKQATDYFGLTAAMLGQHNLQVIGSSLLDTAAKEAVSAGESRLINLKTSTNGKKRIFQVFLAPIIASNNENTGVLAVFHDITALQEMRERQAEFVANASHELGTPLTSIKGFAETLLCGALQDPATSEKFVTIILTEADRMHRLVKDLLQLARLESSDDREQLQIEPIDVSQVLESVIRRLTPQLEEKQHVLRINPPALPVSALANGDYLRQVCINLLDNAIKYTPPGGQISVNWYSEGKHVLISIKDSGPGIPDQDLPRIFERFYRVDRTRARAAGGTGLGLSIVKHLVNSMNGLVSVKSELEKGTTFVVTLPADLNS